MISSRPLYTIALGCVVVLTGIALAQRGFRRNWDAPRFGEEGYRPERYDVPDWDLPKHMPDDVFTFVRLRFSSQWRRGRWATDYPHSDLNFSYRLQELTSMEVNPDGKILEIMDPRLFDYPFVYMIEPGDLWLGDDEAAALRKYMLNGGFLMIDDFWGYREWDGFESAFRKVFPDREIKELDISHPIFHSVFDLQEKPQVPSIDVALAGRRDGVTWEWRKPGSETVEYKGVFDDKGRMMCIICFNTDLGDGWEREGEDEWYFKEFAEKKAYPMGINIVFYALTH